MIIARTKAELNETLKILSNKPGKLALIPTMGNLHDGHLSLIKLVKLKSSKTITTIFINPLQFGNNEDFDKYPKTHELDIEKLEKEQCDVLFMPVNKDEVFPPPGEIKNIEPFSEEIIIHGSEKYNCFSGGDVGFSSKNNEALSGGKA